jgi:hypothetical protein
LKVIERDLLTLAMIRNYSGRKLNELIPHIDNENLIKLHESTFKDDGSIDELLTKLANETYSRVQKKFKKP